MLAQIGSEVRKMVANLSDFVWLAFAYSSAFVASLRGSAPLGLALLGFQALGLDAIALGWFVALPLLASFLGERVRRIWKTLGCRRFSRFLSFFGSVSALFSVLLHA